MTELGLNIFPNFLHLIRYLTSMNSLDWLTCPHTIKAVPHSLHSKSIISMNSLMARKNNFKSKHLPTFFIFLWFPTCINSLMLSNLSIHSKGFPHSLHSQNVSAVWILWFERRIQSGLKTFPHSLYSYDLLPVWILSLDKLSTHSKDFIAFLLFIKKKKKSHQYEFSNI